ncbi:DUF397 domain-containing protein [Streptomyces sp. NPDC059165]|uniref:DUF397 domain-containing protein n=1 Tax=Streptomyces sp. NPDC059165 TaxID=3346751 RepID=UPI00367902BA
MNETTRAAGELSWRKSSHSGGAGGECIEVAECAHAVRVRDSQDPSRPNISIAADAWVAFVGFVAQ